MQQYDPSFEDVVPDDGCDDVDWADPISPQSLVDQINEQGEGRGLAADYDVEMGRVFVCEVVPRVEEHGGMGAFVDEAPARRLCSVDDAHPFSAALGCRIDAFFAERPAQRYDIAEERKKRADAAVSEAHAHDFKSVMALRFRGGARFWNGMESDLVMNRAQRRANEAARRAAESLRKRMGR